MSQVSGCGSIRIWQGYPCVCLFLAAPTSAILELALTLSWASIFDILSATTRTGWNATKPCKPLWSAALHTLPHSSPRRSTSVRLVQTPIR